jgi:hypothetical protein
VNSLFAGQFGQSVFDDDLIQEVVQLPGQGGRAVPTEVDAPPTFVLSRAKD